MRELQRLLRRKRMAAIVLSALLLIAMITPVFAGPEKVEKTGKGFLGVNIQDLDQEQQKKLDITKGVLVIGVTKDSPAEKAGIKKYDVIQKFNGEKVLTVSDLVEAVRAVNPGTEVDVLLYRDGKEQKLTAKIGEYKAGSGFQWYTPGDKDVFVFKGVDQHGYLGVELSGINPELGEYFGVKAEEGVLILKVEKDSPAEKAGLKGGDVILELDGKSISDPGKVSKVVAAYEKGDKIELKILRHKKKKTITAELGETKGLRHLDNFKIPQMEHFMPGSDQDYRIILRDQEHKEKLKQKIKEEKLKKLKAKQSKEEEIKL